MGMLSYPHVHLIRDASKSRNGYVHPFGDANDKRNGLKKPNYFRSKTMQVTYRGVSYNTEDKKSCQKQVSELVYRGIKHTESKTVCAR